MKSVCLYDYFMITLNHKDVHKVYNVFSQLRGFGSLGITGTHEGFVVFSTGGGISDRILGRIKHEASSSS